MVTKTATVSLHSNTYQVEPALVGRKVELVFSPFDMETIEVRYQNKAYGPAIPHIINQHVHPKARREVPNPQPVATGISYLDLLAEDHLEQLRTDQTINYHALTHPNNDNDSEQVIS